MSEIQSGDEIPQTGVRRMEDVIERVEMMALSKNDINFNALSEAQKDKVIDTMAQNEEHAFTFGTQKLAHDKEVKIARITASTFSLKTNRMILLVVAGCLMTITMVILLLRETYFINWLSFITGLLGGSLGGYGLGKSTKSND